MLKKRLTGPMKPAPLGNTYATKLKDPEVRQEAYRQYCEWIGGGHSKEAFVFDHPELSVTSKTMDRYLRENPTEFPPIHKEIAEAKSLAIWEKRGLEMMMGDIPKCQPAIFQMFMRNKFSWDKETHVASTVEPEARRLLEKMEQET